VVIESDNCRGHRNESDNILHFSSAGIRLGIPHLRI